MPPALRKCSPLVALFCAWEEDGEVSHVGDIVLRHAIECSWQGHVTAARMGMLSHRLSRMVMPPVMRVLHDHAALYSLKSDAIMTEWSQITAQWYDIAEGLTLHRLVELRVVLTEMQTVGREESDALVSHFRGLTPAIEALRVLFKRACGRK